MNAEQFQGLLTDLHACEAAATWCKGKSLQQAWRSAKRADWMLWLLGKMADKPGWPTRQRVVLLACDCAETALKYVPKGEDRPKVAIETMRLWARGNATLKQVIQAAADAAYATSAADATSAAADAAYAASAASAAAYAAAYATAAADADAAAYATAAAYAAASYATAAASYATAAVAYATAVSYATAAVAYATAAAGNGAREKTLQELAVLIRKRVPKPYKGE